METVKIGKDEGPVGHGAVSTDLLNRAAQTIDDDKQEDIKKTKQGMPWWVWLVVLIIIVGFLAYMIIRQSRRSQTQRTHINPKRKRGTPPH